VNPPEGESVSQLLNVHVCTVACAVAPTSTGAVTDNVIAAGGAPPATALKVYAEGITVSADTVTPVTLIVTVTVWVTAPAVIEIVPAHVVPTAIPAWLTDTVKFVFAALAVKLPVGDIASHAVLVHVCSDISALAAMFVCAVTVSVCDAGAVAPATALNVIAVVLNVSDDVDDVTLSVTVAVCVTAAAVMEIVPVHVVPAASPA
jgi:hypothetical protein